MDVRQSCASDVARTTNANCPHMRDQIQSLAIVRGFFMPQIYRSQGGLTEDLDTDQPVVQCYYKT